MSWSDEYFELVNKGKKKKKEDEDIAPVRETFETSPYSAMGRLANSREETIKNAFQKTASYVREKEEERKAAETSKVILGANDSKDSLEDEVVSKWYLDSIGVDDWTEMSDYQLRMYASNQSKTPEEADLMFTQLQNQKTVSKNTKILANTKMDGTNVSVLEEMQAIAQLENGKEKKSRKDAVFKKMEDLGIDTDDYALYSGDKNFTWGNFGDWLGSAAMSGLAGFNKGVTATADLLLGNLLKGVGWENNPISSAAEYYSNTYDSFKYDTELSKEKLGGGSGWQFAGEAVEGTIGALPNAIIAIMSAGTSLTGNAVTTGSNLATTAAYETGNVLTRAGLTVEGMLKNPQYWLSFGRTLGSDYEEAKAMGASDTVAALGATFSSLVNSGIEIGTDGLSGIQGLPQDIAEEGGSKLLKWAISGIEEGGEEMMQKFVNEMVAKSLYDEDLEILNPKEYLKEGAIGTIAGFGLGGGQVATQSAINSINRAVQTHQDSKLTANEQKVVDKVVADEIAEQEKDGTKLTTKEKNDIRSKVVEQMEKGYISTDTIEGILGDRTGYDSLQQEANEFNALYTKEGGLSRQQEVRLAELEEKNKANPYETALKTEKDNISKSVFDMVRNDRLSESYREKSRVYDDFQADLDKYKGTKFEDAAKKTIQSAIDAGANNTNRVHDLVDMAAHVSADTGKTFSFKSGEQIKNDFIERQTKEIAKLEAIQNRTAEQDAELSEMKDLLSKVESGEVVVDGDITADGIVLNLDSQKPLNRVVGHEITHSFEPGKGKNSKGYTELKDSLFAYAKTKGRDIDKELAVKKAQYAGVANANPEAELVADLVGDFLFTDTDYVKKLSVENRNVFQKLWDEIKYLCKVATAGSQEYRELARVQKAFEDIYREGGKAEGTSYSISDSTGKQLTKEQQEYFKDSKMRDENGNLKVMYHGSQDAGFHVFDANMSDDGTSFFFVDRNDVAASYSGTSETYEAKTIRTAADMNNFLAEIGHDEDYSVVEQDGKFTLLYEGDRVAQSDTAQGIYEEFCWYEGVGDGDVNYKVYLNLKNPLEVDAKGRPWNKIDAEFSQEVYDKYNSLTAEEKAALVDLAEWEDFRIFNSEIQEARDNELASAYQKMGEDVNIYDLFSVASENFSEEAMRENARKYLKTRDFAQRAKEQGYDGVIFKNIIDNGGYSNGSEGASTVAIAFDSNQIKSTANAKPTGNADIRYSLSANNPASDSLKVMEGGSVSKYSLSTWTPEAQTKVRANLIKAGYDWEQVDKWIKDTNGVASVIAADKDRLDFEAADNQTMLKNNQEYVKTLDASTLCAKRLVYQGTFDAIQHRMPNTMLSSDDLIDLLNMMKEHGVQTPCGVCYVESRRRHLGKFAQEWLNSYNGEYKPNLDEVTTSDGLEALRKSHPETYEDFMTAMKKKGSANPKVVQLRTEYRNEILSLTPAQIRKIESIGGLRVQSFSDFETPHLLDMMQAVMDMSAKGLSSQAYTKVPNFAWVFGDTGIKINLSLIAEGDGFDSNGNLAFSSTEGMDINDAMKLRDAYSQNVGTIIVGANDKHILACMADDRIDFIIPFHRSGWGQKELDMMGMSSYTDYTYGQNEHDLKTGKGVANLYPPDYWDYNLSGKENAERYLNLCAKTGREPKFSQFLVNNGDGSYSLQSDGSTDGYWKTLIDFKMYDNEGNGAAQQKVQPNFNMEEAYRVLAEYEGGANSLPVANDVVDEFVAKYQSREELAPAMSLSNEGNVFAPSRNDVYGSDFRVQQKATVSKEESVAPVAETKNAADVAKNDTSMFPDDFAPVAETDIQSLTDEDAPAEEETYYGEEAPVAPIDPFKERDFKGVGKRNVNAYMYDNPEVKPFFQMQAEAMLGDLRNSTKGEKLYNNDLYYATNGEQGWTGVERQTTDDIAYLLDMGYTYAQIEKGLNDIIEDHGAENNAMAKRIEFALNERLMKGYTDINGFEIPANQEYINLLAQKETAEAVESQIAPHTDADAPISEMETTTEDIAPVREEAYEAIRPKREPQPRMVRADSRGKQRKWVGTSTESEVVDGKILPDDLDQELIHYQPISNKKTLGNANARLDRIGYEASLAYLNGQFANNKVTLDDIALGERLIQEAVKKGDTKTAGDLIMDISILGTELGQKVQALSIIKRLTPEGQLRMLQRTVERGKAKGDKAFDGVEITQDMIDYILKTYGKDGTFDQDELNKRVEDVKQKIADQMSVSAMDYINEWRYLSMLGNPKTHIRNVVSNMAMAATRGTKNVLARTMEDLFVKKNRTKTWKMASDDVKNFTKQTAAELDSVISGDKYSENGSIKAKRKIFKTKAGNWLSNANSGALSWEDGVFSKPVFRNSFQEFLTANGIKTEADIKKHGDIVAKAKQYALAQAKEATFQQDSYIANKISEIERKNPLFNIAVGSVMPFKKTPINIAKTAAAYSPLGFARNIYDAVQVSKGNMDASEAVDHLAQTLTGTSLTLIGYALASMGVLNGAGDDDKEGKYDYQLGKQSYSFNFNGDTYSLSWLSPVAMPLFVGTNAYEKFVEGMEMNGDVIVETLAQTLDPLSEMSFLSSLDSVLSSYDSGIQKFVGIFETAGQNYITQFVPTLSSQIASTLDDTKRTTKVAADSDFKFLDETVNQLMYKIPGLRTWLEPSTDIWGNEVKQSEDVLTRAFESFLAPYARREDISTAVDEEIKDLYSQTGDTGLIPSIPNNYLDYDGEKYKMSAEEYTDFKKMYGQNAFDLMEQLFNTDTYRGADSETRADMVNDVYDYARDEAKKEFFAKYGVDFTNATKEGEEYYRENPIKGAIERDMPVDEYVFSEENPGKYTFFKKNGISYSQYASADEDGKRAYTWAYENPGKYTMSKAITDDLVTYRKYTGDLYDIRADKDSSGKSISGSAKEKKIEYINNLDLEYGQRIILFKSLYEADDTYNSDIVNYLNSRDDISYEDMETILKELGFEVDSYGNISW